MKQFFKDLFLTNMRCWDMLTLIISAGAQVALTALCFGVVDGRGGCRWCGAVAATGEGKSLVKSKASQVCKRLNVFKQMDKEFTIHLRCVPSMRIARRITPYTDTPTLDNRFNPTTHRYSAGPGCLHFGQCDSRSARRSELGFLWCW